MGMFDQHQAMQSQQAHLQRKVHWQALRSSPWHLGMLAVYAVWAVIYITLIILDRHGLWSGIVTVLMIISMYPFQLIPPRRRLATAFLRLNIRPTHCGYCEYDLQASDGDTCPECGTPLAPKIPSDVQD